MSDSLESAVQSARRAIGDDGEIPYAQRRVIRDLLIASGDNSWAALEASCARKAISVWQGQFPTDNEPAQLLSAAEADRTLGVAELDLADRVRRLKTRLDDLFDLGDEAFRAIYSGFACWAAARDVFIGVPVHPPNTVGEKEIPPPDWDASFLASLAVCGGATWEDGVGDPVQRRAFWIWFLDVAIPNALRHRMQ